MTYNMDFLIAALLFLLMILGHSMQQRRMDIYNNQTFFAFLLIGIADILFDILCTVMISKESPQLAWLLRLSMFIFYLLQILVPYALQCHMLTQYRNCGRRSRVLWTIPPVLMGLLVVANLQSGLLYTVNDEGCYVRGALYQLMYVYTLAYVVAFALFAVLHRKDIGCRKVLAVWEIVFFSGTCVAIQAVNNELMMTGFGVALGITVLFFTMNNPYMCTDNLTGAFDVKYFHERVRDLLARKREFHLIVVNLRQLRQINLRFGLGAGDRMLIQTVQMLRSINRRNLVFRLSGRRFLLLTFDIAGYESALTDIQRYFSGSSVQENGGVRCSAMICGVTHAERFSDSGILMEYANYLTLLMPDGPETGVIQDNEESRRGFRYEQAIESYLPEALEADRFELHFQPIYSLREGKFVSIEALSRMHHPTLGPVAPDVFIRILERNDMIARFDLQQLRRACRFLRENAAGLAQIRSVKFNLSPQELMKEGHAQKLVDVIRESGLSPALFHFEITETVATEYGDNLQQAVRTFTEAGIGLCLDDFGAGFANLNAVLKLPFSTIKMDRSLLTGICEDEKVVSFYRNMVALLQNMGYTVVAEGVENPRERELVRNWGVDMIQGFSYSKPLTGSDLLELLREQRRAG